MTHWQREFNRGTYHGSNWEPVSIFTQHTGRQATMQHSLIEMEFSHVYLHCFLAAHFLTNEMILRIEKNNKGGKVFECFWGKETRVRVQCCAVASANVKKTLNIQLTKRL